MTFPFDTRYEPPFPALQVVLRNDHQDRSTGELPALLDTGADGTHVNAYRHVTRYDRRRPVV